MKIDYDTLFTFVDDFCKGFESWYKKQLIGAGTIQRNRACRLSLSEILTILIAYHQSACFKYFQSIIGITGLSMRFPIS